MYEPTFLFDGPETALVTVAVAHGAGAAMDSPFMNFFAAGLAQQGCRVVRFEFPYMAARRRGGSRRPPDRLNVLLDCWQSVIDRLGSDRLVIGGKSLGGRMASMMADRNRVRGLVCLGYPFHPPGRPETLRIEHLLHIHTPTLILQGARDPFGTQADVAGYPLSSAIRLHWLADGDHGFKPRVVSGRTEQQNWLEALAAVSHFIEERRAG